MRVSVRCFFSACSGPSTKYVGVATDELLPTHTHTLTLVPIRSGQWPFWYLASKLPLANDLARLTVLKNKRKEKLISATSGSQIDINKVSTVSADTLPQCEGEESVCSERLASPYLTPPRLDV